MNYKPGGFVIKQDPPTIPTALWVLQFLFGFHGFVLYRWLRPSWNPWHDPTATAAKARLAWCVKARRDGGYWAPKIAVGGHTDNPLGWFIPERVYVARWVNA